MDELIKKISEELGVSQDKAREAIDLTDHYLKGKLPQELYDEVDVVLETSDIKDAQTRELGLFRIP